jgi:regulatory protein
MAEETLYKTALAKAMAICSRSEHCIDDIKTKLRSWNIEEHDSEKIIKILISENFINEERYASSFVRDKFRYNKWGRIKIKAALRMKKIPGDIITSSVNSIDPGLYKKALEDMLIVHRKSVRAKNQYDLKGKLLRYGLSKGFESDLLYDILVGLE